MPCNSTTHSLEPLVATTSVLACVAQAFRRQQNNTSDKLVGTRLMPLFCQSARVFARHKCVLLCDSPGISIIGRCHQGPEVSLESYLLDQGITLMLVGMGTVFAFLTMLVGSMSLMSSIAMRFAPVESDNDPSEEEIAAITAAITQHRINTTK